MKIETVHYSSSLGIQTAAVNFAIKYRISILENRKVEQRVYDSFKETERVHSKSTGMKLLEIGIDRDHVHIVVQWGPGIPLSKIIQLLKGRSARDVFKSYPEMKSDLFWSGHFWSPAYHFLTTGPSDLKHHLEYVRNQGKRRYNSEGQKRKGRRGWRRRRFRIRKRPFPKTGQMSFETFGA
jgi:REP element-mobilizing transposase RayT